MIRLDPDRRRVHGPRGRINVAVQEYTLLALLLRAGFNQPVGVDKIADVLWPSWTPAMLTNSIQSAVARINERLRYVGGAWVFSPYPGVYKVQAIPTRVPLARAA